LTWLARPTNLKKQKNLDQSTTWTFLGPNFQVAAIQIAYLLKADMVGGCHDQQPVDEHQACDIISWSNPQ